MRSFRARIEEIEAEMMERSGLSRIDFSSMTNEELEEVNIIATKGSLRLRLHREPTDEEIVAEQEAVEAYLDSLSSQELARLAEGGRKRGRR